MKSGALFSQLPPELLVETVCVALPEPTVNKTIRAISNPELLPALIRHSSVCRKWKGIINGAATLWAFLSADRASVSRLRLAFEGSQSAPLVITTGNLTMNSAAFLEIIKPQVHRSQSLCVMPFVPMRERLERRRVDWDHDATYVLLQQPCPAPEELHISGEREPPGQRNMPWNATNLRGLDLKALRLFSANHQDPLLRLETVNIKLLQTLISSAMKTVDMAGALQCITTPSLRKLILSTTYAGGESPFTHITPSPYYHNSFRSIVTAEKGPIGLYASDEALRLVISKTDDGSEVSIEWLPVPWEPTSFVKWLAVIWNPLSYVASICLNLGNVTISHELMASLTHIKNISSFRISKEVEDAHHLYELLLRPAPLEGGANNWPFPRLATLQVVESLEVAEVNGCLAYARTRGEVGGEPKGWT
ncbi:hypothetical protein FRB90_001861 [Tulasnella sp. 427]|nr:hypothetical protein FRB90_001861 [Tulasnella sp. 427]